jgi:hypothetical protein
VRTQRTGKENGADRKVLAGRSRSNLGYLHRKVILLE